MDGMVNGWIMTCTKYTVLLNTSKQKRYRYGSQRGKKKKRRDRGRLLIAVSCRSGTEKGIDMGHRRVKTKIKRQGRGETISLIQYNSSVV